jgi:hypothetical protein
MEAGFFPSFENGSISEFLLIVLKMVLPDARALLKEEIDGPACPIAKDPNRTAKKTVTTVPPVYFY